jgi:hypothetical protein
MQEKLKKELSRREFGRMAVTAAGVSLVPRLASARPSEQKTPAPAPAPKPAEGTTPPSAEAVALAGIVKLRYGARLNDDELKEITRSLDSGLKGAEALRKASLENSDEPAFVFRAWRRDHA